VFGRVRYVYQGGAFGYYHIGVVKALLDTNTLPQVMTGTSAGSLLAAIFCVQWIKRYTMTIFTPELSKECSACETSLSVNGTRCKFNVEHYTNPFKETGAFW
jgi:predicted acylesterase/phospholipase RssA